MSPIASLNLTQSVLGPLYFGRVGVRFRVCSDARSSLWRARHRFGCLHPVASCREARGRSWNPPIFTDTDGTGGETGGSSWRRAPAVCAPRTRSECKVGVFIAELLLASPGLFRRSSFLRSVCRCSSALAQPWRLLPAAASREGEVSRVFADGSDSVIP